jgi:hypothetical protein
MKKVLFILPAFLVLAGALWAQEASIVYFVVPLEKNAATAGTDPAKARYVPMLSSNYAKKVLYYLEPMGRKIKSYVPKKDSMGMDYIPVYVDESSKKALFYLNPMDRKTVSPKPTKDSMGMDYIPVYEMKVFEK